MITWYQILYVVIGVAALILCIYTLRRINRIKTYCDNNFDKIGGAILSTNKAIGELVFR